MFFKKTIALLLALTMSAMMVGCGNTEPAESNAEPSTESTVEPIEEPDDEPVEAPVEIKGSIRLATTTSTKDSGLLDYILPEFTYSTGWEVDVISVGSGEAMSMGEKGEADVLLVHSPASETAFVEGGHADENGRADVMYNDFVLVGPEADPAKIKEKAPADAVAALTEIHNAEATFISRGDESGTHKKELTIWDKSTLTPAGDWYVEAASGMGAVITMADELLGYTLSDRATWLNTEANTDLVIVCEKDPTGTFDNQYGVISVNPEKNEQINLEGAEEFREWILSTETQELIGEFGIEDFGAPLFTPNAQ